ncbi:hypothetical protein AA11825_1919 [Acetobacter pomorum DSM 11825]|nr:hypothetical protein AA11825_1919 [Acetobacter pomorum DSM 11825]
MLIQGVGALVGPAVVVSVMVVLAAQVVAGSVMADREAVVLAVVALAGLVVVFLMVVLVVHVAALVGVVDQVDHGAVVAGGRVHGAVAGMVVGVARGAGVILTMVGVMVAGAIRIGVAVGAGVLHLCLVQYWGWQLVVPQHLSIIRLRSKAFMLRRLIITTAGNQGGVLPILPLRIMEMIRTHLLLLDAVPGNFSIPVQKAVIQDKQQSLLLHCHYRPDLGVVRQCSTFQL